MFTVSLGAKTSHTVIHKKISAYHLDVNHKQALRPYVSTEQHIHQTSRENQSFQSSYFCVKSKLL